MRDLANFACELLEGAAASKTPRLEIDPAEGDPLLELFFADGRERKQWCHRRVVALRFLAARRGQWTTIVDFTLDKRFGEIAPLSDGDEVLIPLFTFSKDVMPPAHVRTEDEKGHVLALGSTRPSRLIECMMLIALAEKAKILADVSEDLADLTDTDPRLATRSFERIERHIHEHSAAIGPPETDQAAALVRFASAARVFYRSTILLVPFPTWAVKKSIHKIVSLTYDAPIRLTKYAPEFVGYSPLRVAPLTIFGGNAESYHVQLEPPDGVVVVNTRLLYAYTACKPRTDKPEFPDEDLADEELHDLANRAPLALGLSRLGLKSYGDKGSPVVARPLSRRLLKAGWSRLWGTVLGSAEPLAAHVRVNAGKLPGLIEGRDVITMFQLYPDMSAFSGLIVGTLLNYAFLLALYLAVHGDLSLISPGHPEPLFIVGALIAGFGSGLALYRREHLITEQVARPWRILFGVQVAMTILSLATLLAKIDAGVTPDKRTAISCFFFAGSGALAYLAVISLRAGVAQRAGGRLRYGWQGFAPRRRWFRAHWYSDDLGDARHSSLGAARAKRLIRHTAEHYLNERYRRKLFNQGVPAASRHDPGSRGSTRSWG
jgi:hypothetical protein